MKIFICLIQSFCLVYLIGCYSQPSNTDLAKLNEIQNKYTDFEFMLIDEFYLKVKLRKDMPVSENYLREIYKIFFFDETNDQPRETTYVYLNYYDSEGKFQYQIAFDAKNDSFIHSQSEYY